MRKELVEACFDSEQKFTKACKVCGDVNDAIEISERFADFCCDILTKEEQIELARLVLEHMSDIILKDLKVGE